MAFPATYNIDYYEGDTYEFIIYPKTANGLVFDLDGYTSAFNIASATGPSPSFTVGGSAIINSAKTQITCKILPAVGRQLVAGTTYYYDVQVSNGIEKVNTLLKGTISVTADVTGA
jgi:hypothetical protein